MPDINLPQPESPDIYSYGFGKNLNRENESNSTGVVYDAMGESLNVAQLLSGGDLSLKSLSIGGLVKQVAPGDDIQAAIDAVNREGGGTIQLLAKRYILSNNIEIKDKVALIGAGRDLTILDFESKGFQIISKNSTNFRLENFTVQNSSKANGAIYIYDCDYFAVNNIKSYSNSEEGFNFYSCDTFVMNDCLSDSNDRGYLMTGSCQLFTAINCKSVSSTNEGWDLIASRGAFISCSSGNGGVISLGDDIGFQINGGNNVVFLSCSVSGHGSEGFHMPANGSDHVFLGCWVDSGDTGSESWNFTSGQGTIMIGCQSSGNTSTGPQVSVSDNCDVIMGNSNFPGSARKEIVQMENTSGQTLRRGIPVILKATTSGDEITTTSTIGDDKVFGVLTGNVFNNSWSSVQTLGKTNSAADGLWVSNGATSIVVGDYLSTYSHAYYANKAVAGDMAFAIAMETPTTGTAEISALLISPRKI